MTDKLYYSDVVIRDSFDNHDADTIGVFPIASKVVSVIHGVNKKYDNKIALDFIKDDKQFTIRIFHHDRIWLAGVVVELTAHHIIRDYTKVIQPMRVRKATKFVVNRRKRVHDKLSIAHQASLAYCKTLLHFHLLSKSNKNRYIINIEQSFSDEPIGEFNPSNYGLSTNDMKFSLPRF